MSEETVGPETAGRAESGGPTAPDQGERLHLFSWRDPPVLAVAALAMAAGFGQFGAVSALGDVSRAFGHVTQGSTVADRVGLSTTTLGIGLAVLRLASLAGLPLTGLADRFGRRPTILWSCALGLLLTILAALSPDYWWFVVIFAVGRPFLSATNGVASVMAAEHTPSAERAKSVALVAAGYGVGAGLTAVINGLWKSTLGFRGLFALAVVPLVLVPILGRRVLEPSRFDRSESLGEHGRPVLGPVGPLFRKRLVIVSVLAFALSLATGPVTSFFYVYAQNVEKLSGALVSGLVVLSGLTGLAGLLVGRSAADRIGRRPTTAIGVTAIVATGILTYSGSRPATGIGFVLGVMAASFLAPAAGAFITELFPTSVRASVVGWQIAAGVVGAVLGLVLFGSVAEVTGQFVLAALLTFLPVVLSIVLLALLPETRGREPEDLWVGMG